MSTKKKILIFVLVVLLVLAVILCAASCSAGGQEQPEATALPTAPEATAEPTEPEVTEPLETEIPTKAEPIVMETAGPPAAEPPAKPVDTGLQTGGAGSQSGGSKGSTSSGNQTGSSQSGTSSGQNNGSQSNAGGTSESNQDLQTSIPAETALPATQPPVIPTQVPTTEPVGCQHEWQSVYHPEEGHYGDYWLVCKCGYQCKTLDEMFSHQDSFLGGADLLDHINYGETRDYIVDSPEYYEWVCSKCGATSDTQP